MNSDKYLTSQLANLQKIDTADKLFESISILTKRLKQKKKPARKSTFAMNKFNVEKKVSKSVTFRDVVEGAASEQTFIKNRKWSNEIGFLGPTEIEKTAKKMLENEKQS